MRLVVLIVGILLIAGAAWLGPWWLTLAAAVLTAFALIRFFDFYRSIPFLLILLAITSFFLAGSPWLRGSEFRYDRAILLALISVAVCLISALACAEILVVQQGGSRQAAHKMMISLIVAPLFPTTNPLGGLFTRFARSFRALQIIHGGRVVHSMPESEDFRVLGPGALIIRSGNAAVLERSGKITRIVGPGFYVTEPFEHLSAIVDLSLQCALLDEEDVLTKDSVPLKIEGTVQYGIMIDQPALIKKGEYRLDEDAIRRAVLTTANWREQTEIVAKGVLRDTIAMRFLDEIYDPRSLHFTSGATPRIPLQDELRRRLSRESQRWGVEIARVTLDKIMLPEKVQERMVEAWDTTWHDVVQMARALTEAKEITAKALGAGQVAQVEAIGKARARLQAVGIDSLFRLLEADGEAQAKRRAAQIGQQTTWFEARGEAMAELEAAEISSKTAKFDAQRRVIEARGEAGAQMLEAIGEAAGKLGSAEIGGKTAKFDAQRRVIEARGEADAQMLEAIGEAAGKLGSAKIGSKAAEFEAQRRVIEARGEADAQMIEGHAKAVTEADRFREVLLSLRRDFSFDDKTLYAVTIQLASVLTDVTDLQSFVRFLTGNRPFLPETGPVVIGGDGMPSDQG